MVKRSSPEGEENPGLVVSTEHILVQSQGGPDAAWNRVAACCRCNGLRSDLPFEIFEPFARIILRKYPDAPAAVLRSGLKRYIIALAEVGIRKQREAKGAVLVALLEIGEQLKGH